MEYLDGEVKVNSVTLGVVGGSIFSGKVQGTSRIVVCKISAKKCLRYPKSGEVWKVKGKKVNHDEYRDFINVDEARISPLSPSHIQHYLSKNAAFRGIGFGKKKIDKLIEEFGTLGLVQALNDGRKDHLSEVIKPHIADRLIDVWKKLADESELASFLTENNIPDILVSPIVKICSYNTLSRLKRNPYVLVSFSYLVPNIWKSLDTLGSKLGIQKDDYRRLIAYVELVLYQALDEGSTAMEIAHLKKQFMQIISDESLFLGTIKEGLNNKNICLLKQEGKTYIQPIGAALIELSVEKNISELIQSPVQFSLDENYEEEIEVYRESFRLKHGFNLNEGQSEAIKNALTNKVSVITGYGGTGKTTVLRAIVELSKKQTFVLALSGKAKERAREATGVDTYTIHSFINHIKSNSIELSGNPLIIIDESSMVDISLINRLFRQLSGIDFSMTMVGDTGQLSPVGFGLFWHRLAVSSKISITHLTQVYRTNSNSLHEAAMRIRGGELGDIPLWNGEQSGIYRVDQKGSKEDLATTLLSIREKIGEDQQIITPYMNGTKTEAGSFINKAIQKSRNTKGQQQLEIGTFSLHIGDPVIVNVNCYSRGLFNGNVGKLIRFEYVEDQVRGIFEIEGFEYSLSAGDCIELKIKLAYAITIHKSQGSEYDACIVCISSDSAFIDRSLLYTAVTRAKNLTLLVGDYGVMQKAAMRSNRADVVSVGFNI